MQWKPTPIPALTNAFRGKCFDNTCTANLRSMVSNISAYVMWTYLISVTF